MAKRKKSLLDQTTVTINGGGKSVAFSGKKIKQKLESMAAKEARSFDIKEATIKDDFCNYSYEIIEGIGIGDTHKVTGTGIIDDDLRKAFSRFNVHLAVIDEVFKHSDIEIDDIDTLHNHDLTDLFKVTAFKIKGARDDESIILIGEKYVSSAGGRMDLETPKITLDNLSSYKWYNELKTAADDVRREVALYKEGKYTAVEEDEEGEDSGQGNLFAGKENETEDDFEKAKV